MPLFNKKRSAEWPADDSGKPVAPAVLTRADARAMEADIIINMLSAYGIPAITTLPGESMIGKVILGQSGRGGSDIYVPETMLEDALELLQDTGETAASDDDGGNAT